MEKIFTSLRAYVREDHHQGKKEFCATCGNSAAVEALLSFREIEKEYHKLADERGAIIKNITRIERTEDVPFLFEDADFSISTIKKLIKQGEDDVENALTKVN
jgi:hypothetical protein